MTLCVVQFHGFKDEKNKWIIKELAAVADSFTFNAVFRSPYSKKVIKCYRTRQSITWLEHNYHLIRWDDGEIPYSHDFVKGLLKPFDVIYTKGLEKKMFLEQYHKNVQEIGGPSLDAPYTGKCCLPKHCNGTEKCALKSASCYYKYVKYMSEAELMDVDQNTTTMDENHDS